MSCSPLIGDVGWDGLGIWVYLGGIRRRTIGARVGWKRLETQGEIEKRWMVFGLAGSRLNGVKFALDFRWL